MTEKKDRSEYFIETKVIVHKKKAGKLKKEKFESDKKDSKDDKDFSESLSDLFPTKNFREATQSEINVEKEHSDLYEEIKSQFEKDGKKFKMSLEEFSKFIAQEHVDEKSDYYKLLEKHVEPDEKLSKNAKRKLKYPKKKTPKKH